MRVVDGVIGGCTKQWGDGQGKGQGTSKKMREMERRTAGETGKKKEAGERRQEREQLRGE